jgi:glycosyltransferase involved in cell wall biosynthesis
MSQQPKNQSYQQALTLAERGQYEEALGMIREYLRGRPDDGEALNDAGTILFCMRRGAEAIELFEKACGHLQGVLQEQALWNLSEAYIQEDRPAEAYKLFDTMAEVGILNADVLNRTADAFLSRDALGGTMECLLRSLKMSPQQEILEPMLKVVRSRRPAAVVAGDEEDQALRHIRGYLEPRFRSGCIVGNGNALSSTQAGIIITVGAGGTLRDIAVNKGTRKLIAVLRPQDVYADDLESIAWQNVDMVFVCGTSAQMDVLTERLPNLGKQTIVQPAAEPFATDDLPLTHRGRGKKLAAVGPFDAHHNPVLLLQCMQKLHYLDADYRLYLAGEFQDKAVQQYCRWMTARMNLEGVVFFEGPVSNIEKWLRDKHIIVSSAIDAGGIRGVWTGMACGLRPVVHSFAGAQECVPQSVLFDIAEDFCSQIRNSDPTAENYRGWLERKLNKDGFDRLFTAGLLKLERQIHLSSSSRQDSPATIQPAQPVIQQARPAITPLPAVHTAMPQSRPISPVSRPVQNTQPIFPANPINPVRLTGGPAPSPAAPLPWETAVPSPAAWTPPVPAASAIPAPGPASLIGGKSINEAAAEALKASQRLREILQQAGSSQEQAGSSRETFSVPFAR